MVGLGTNKVNMADSLFTFTSFLGRDGESYGLSYTGALRHNATVTRENVGFCKGSIIGVKVDLWQGTLEFYLNRKSQGKFLRIFMVYWCIFIRSRVNVIFVLVLLLSHRK